MPDPLTAERLAEIQRRTLGWLPLDEWGPKCHGCGGDEYRIDGYCSVECRDYHDDLDVAELLAEVERLQGELATLEGYVDHHVQQEAKLHSRVLQLERELADAREALRILAEIREAE